MEDLLQHIYNEVRDIRKRLDEHVADENQRLDRIREKINVINEITIENKAKLYMITIVISAVVAGVVSFIVDHGRAG